MASDYARALGARLRAIRTQQGLSLHGVEEKSEGRWKAVVVGSYERGDRAVTVQRLAELADFYGVPVRRAAAGRGHRLGASSRPPKLVLDLERLRSVPAERAGPLARYAATIQGQRGDYNGKVLSIRQDDLRTLAVIYDMPPAALAEQLISWGVLDADARRAVERSMHRLTGLSQATRRTCATPSRAGLAARATSERERRLDGEPASRPLTNAGESSVDSVGPARPPRRSPPRPARRRRTAARRRRSAAARGRPRASGRAASPGSRWRAARRSAPGAPSRPRPAPPCTRAPAGRPRRPLGQQRRAGRSPRCSASNRMSSARLRALRASGHRGQLS